MTSSDDLQLPRDPGPVPAPLRDAYAWARDGERASSASISPDDAALDAFAESDGDDDARFAMIEQLLGSTDGARTLAHLMAAKTSTSGADEYFNESNEDAPEITRRFASGTSATRQRQALSRLKPLFLAASLMLVAGTSWYVFTLPRGGDEVRSVGSSVELLRVPPVGSRTPIKLQWKPLREDARYSVEVLDANDIPVFSNDTNSTEAIVPAASLKPGTYRWYVRARSTDRTEVRSRVESFTVQ
jgi:hypothetical protein